MELKEKKTPLKNVKKIYSIKYSISRCEKVNEGKKTYLRLSGHESRIRKEKKNIFTSLNKITYIYIYIYFFFYVTYVVNCRESLKKRERERFTSWSETLSRLAQFSASQQIIKGK